MDKSETYQLILEGFILYYNYLRPHESLKGRTPAQVAKIDFPYRSWLDIIRSEIPKPELPPQLEPKPDRVLTLNEIRRPYRYKPYRKRTKPKRRIVRNTLHV